MVVNQLQQPVPGQPQQQQGFLGRQFYKYLLGIVPFM